MSHKQTIYVTTPIYYASGKPHLGHAFTTILADTYCAYQKLLGNQVLFLTGMDEHGQKIAEKASKENMNPQDYVNQIASQFKELWAELHIDYDCFIRTTSSNHCEVIKKVFDSLYNNKQIYLDKWKGLYCVQCEENYKKADAIKKDGKLYCKVGHELQRKNEESYFLKLSNQQNWLKDYYQAHPDFLIPSLRVHELLNNFINPGLEDLSVTRTTIQWGVPTNINPHHILYVWIDALMAYLTGIGYDQENDQLFNKFWQNKKAKRIHFIGKEITRFHGIYWPILLKDMNLNLPSQIVSHGWIITKQGKMSKSLGNVIDPLALINQYGSDFLRYYLIKNIAIDHDGVYSEDLAIDTYNSDLANNYGNFISRSLGMISKYNSGKIPRMIKKNLNKKEIEIIDLVNQLYKDLPKLVDQYAFIEIIERAINLCNAANKYIENTKPWDLFKDKKQAEIKNFLNIIANVAIFLTWVLSPILKAGTLQSYDQYNIQIKQLYLGDQVDFNAIAGHKTNVASPIYKRIMAKEKK